jgi:hypothetical protein
MAKGLKSIKEVRQYWDSEAKPPSKKLERGAILRRFWVT